MMTRQKYILPKITIERIVTLILNLFFLIFHPLPNICAQKSDLTEADKVNLEKPFRFCWEFLSENTGDSIIASDNETGLFAASLGILKSIDVSSGEIEWQSEIGGEIKTRPVRFRDQVIVLSENNETFGDDQSLLNGHEQFQYTVHSLNKTTGITVWKYAFGLNMQPARYFLNVAGESLLVLSDLGNVLILNAADGKLQKAAGLNSKLSAEPIFDSEEITFATVENRIVSYRKVGSNLIKESDIKVSTMPTALVKDRSGNFLWGNSRGLVTLSNRRGDTKWKFRSGGKIEKIVKTYIGFLIVSLDNYLYLLADKKAGGSIIWKKRLTERPAFAPEIVGDYAVIAADVRVGAIVVELISGKTVNIIASRSDGFLQASPISVGGTIILPTVRGYSAYSSVNCSSKP